MSVGFLDEVEVHVIGGRGGRGCVAFRREKFVPRGGPSGGDGGHGGAVVLVATRGLNTLSSLRHRGRHAAEGGRPGEGGNRHGRSGHDEEIRVPPGTVVHDVEAGVVLADLREPGDRFVVAAGGRGGRGNARFATSRNRAPRRADPGEEGEDRWVRLELKLLADVGLVGLPNAGKSTLISRMSAARPKVAAYPFTTLVPNLGVVDWGDYQSYVVADIPGLIEGSHRGDGLGDRFLRHVERTAVLVHLVDVSEEAQGEPAARVATIESELEAFDRSLLTRPMLLVATKIDAAGDGARLDGLRRLGERRGLPVHAVSSVTGEGVAELIRIVGELVERARAEADAGAPAADAGRAP